MPAFVHPPGFAGTTLLLFSREAWAKFASPWFYLVASLVCVIAWLYGAGFAQSFATESVLVTTNPLLGVDVLVVIFLGIVLGLRLASGIAWEREHRTLEVLVVGPASFEAVVIAKFLVELCVFAALTAVYMLYLLLAQPLGAGVIDVATAMSVGQMPVHALPTLALGLLVSAWAATVRGAVLAYLMVVAILAAFEMVLALLLAREPAELSLSAVYLRSGLQVAANFIDPASPIARLAHLAGGLTAQTPLLPTATWHAFALTLVTLALAALLCRVRGVVV
jgi:ABC-type transport system involved in multi-copper enzyme maturation permease subunit